MIVAPSCCAGQLIRINPDEPQVPPGKGVPVAAGGLAALQAIAERLAAQG